MRKALGDRNDDKRPSVHRTKREGAEPLDARLSSSCCTVFILQRDVTGRGQRRALSDALSATVSPVQDFEHAVPVVPAKRASLLDHSTSLKADLAIKTSPLFQKEPISMWRNSRNNLMFVAGCSVYTRYQRVSLVSTEVPSLFAFQSLINTDHRGPPVR